MLQAIVIAGAVVAKIVERLRDEWAILDGWKVNATAVGLGVLIAFGFGLAGFTALLADHGVEPARWADILFTGVSIGLFGGVIQDFTGRSPRA